MNFIAEATDARFSTSNHLQAHVVGLIRTLTEQNPKDVSDVDLASCELYRLCRSRTGCHCVKNAGGYRAFINSVRESNTLHKLYALGCLHQMHALLDIQQAMENVRPAPTDLVEFVPSQLVDALDSGRRSDDEIADILTRLSCLMQICPRLQDDLRQAGLTSLLVSFLDGGSSLLVTEATIAMGALAHGNPQSQLAVGATDAIARLVKLLVVGDEDQSAHAAAVIAEVVDTCVTNSAAVVAAGGIRPLVELLRHGNDMARDQVARVLASLAIDTDARAAIEKAGAIIPLVALVRSGDDLEKLYATSVLTALAADEYNQIVIARAGSVEPLVALVCFGNDAQKAAAALALAKLSIHPDTQTLIIQAGGLEPLIHMVATGNATQQLNALTALATLTNSPSASDKLIRMGAMQLLTDVVCSGPSAQATVALVVLSAVERQGGSNASVIDDRVAKRLVQFLESDDEQCVASALEATRVCSESDESKNILSTAGVIDRIVRVAQSGQESIRVIVADILAKFAVITDHHAVLEAAGGVVVLVQCLRSSTMARQRQITRALCVLSTDEQASAGLVDVGGIDAAVEVLIAGCELAKYDAIMMLKTLAMNSTFSVRMVQASALDPLTALARNGDPELQQAAVETLAAVASNPANRDALAEARVLDTLVELAQQGCETAKTRSMDALIDMSLHYKDDVFIQTLARSGPFDRLVARLRDANSTRVLAPLRALKLLGSQENERVLMRAAGTIEVLVGLLRTANREVKAAAAWVLVWFGDKATTREAIVKAGAVDLLVLMLAGDSDAAAQRAATSVLLVLTRDDDTVPKILHAGVITRLVPLIQRGALEVKDRAITLLGCLSHFDSDKSLLEAEAKEIPALLELLRDKDATDDAKVAAAEIFVGMAASDEDGDVISKAPDAVDCLLELLGSGSPSVRASCMVTAGWLGATGSVSGAVLKSSGTISLLVAALESEDESVCQRAVAIVAKMYFVPHLQRIVCEAGATPLLQKYVATRKEGAAAPIAKYALQKRSMLETVREYARQFNSKRRQARVHTENITPNPHT